MLEQESIFHPHRRLLVHIFILSVCLLMVLRTFSLLSSLTYPVGYDARSYILAAHAIRLGYSPYETASLTNISVPVSTPTYLYPPLFAFLLIPLSFLPFLQATYVCVALAAISGGLLVVNLSRIVDWRLAVLAVFVFPPAWHTIYLGQVNLLVASLVTFALLNIQRDKMRNVGVALALGTLLKITPILLVYVVIKRCRYHILLAFAGTIIGSILITLPFINLVTWLQGGLAALQQQWTSSEFVSWTGLCAYWMETRGELIGIALSLSLLSLTLLRISRTSFFLALAAVILLPLLIARITWDHHAVMALPALALLWQSTPVKRGIAASSWILIGLFGGVVIPITLTICWIACCWPNFRVSQGEQQLNRLLE